jgi:thiol-disulfide isomerase/thioredoxin
MMTVRHAFANVVACLAALGVVLHAGPPAPAKTLPDVAVHDARGLSVRLATFKGKIMLVDFWASWCLSCKASFPALDNLAQEYEPHGVTVLAINVDERRRDAEVFLSEHPHSMTVLFDPKGVAPQAFDVVGMPSSFVIDRTGVIRFTHMGYSGAVAEQYRTELNTLLREQP